MNIPSTSASAIRFQGKLVHEPRARHLKPNRDFLAERYTLFKKAG
jgi:hypothetical protein